MPFDMLKPLVAYIPTCFIPHSGRRRREISASRRAERVNQEEEERLSRKSQKLSSRNRHDNAVSSSSRMIQQACPFFTRLPLEIRLLIYEEVLGNHILHMLSLSGRVGVKICTLADSASTENDHQRACFPAKPRPAGDPPRSDGQLQFLVHGADYSGDFALQKSITPILRTCRQIYVEANDILYKSNLFDFAYAETFSWFRKSIQPEKLALITRLQVGRYLPLSPWWFHWEQMFLVISKMPDLKYLSIYTYNRHGFAANESSPWIAHLSKLRGLRTFNLVTRTPPEVKGGEYLTLELPSYAVTMKETALLPKEEESAELRRRFVRDMDLMMRTT
jgi:hypothetical protein